MTDEEKVALLEEARTEDGGFDEKKVLDLFAKKQSEVDSLYKESKKRGEKLKTKDEVLAEREKQIVEREARIQESDAVKLKDDEKYLELIALREAEIERLKGVETKAAELEEFKKNIREKQAARLEGKVNELPEKNRELYEAVASGMAEDAYDAKLTVLEKLTAETIAPVATAPSGGRETTGTGDYKDPRELFALKTTNPDLYKSIIRERVAGKKD